MRRLVVVLAAAVAATASVALAVSSPPGVVLAVSSPPGVSARGPASSPPGAC
ncbi:MAG: hypothetical protein ACR2NB_00265 [Solirubrobacteraceae bacterium]